MKTLTALLFTVLASSAFAVETSTSYLCFRTCTFEGIAPAESACEAAAQGFNLGAVGSVHMSASCYTDRSNICGPRSPFCTFGSIVLQRDVTILK